MNLSSDLEVFKEFTYWQADWLWNLPADRLIQEFTYWLTDWLKNLPTDWQIVMSLPSSWQTNEFV
jgi:hypothetical protein